MAIRAVITVDPLDSRRAILLQALQAYSAGIEINGFRSRLGWDGRGTSHAPAYASPATRSSKGSLAQAAKGASRWLQASATSLSERLPFGSLLRLAAYRPNLVITEGFGSRALRAAFYRLFSRRSRLLLCVAEPPSRSGIRERIILGMADGLLADGDATLAFAKLRFPLARTFPLSTPLKIDAFLACDCTRTRAQAHRLVFAGDLSPGSGTADFLTVLAAWAAENPSQPVEIWWAGEGDLAGVLGAQPLPATVSQRFFGALDATELAAVFGQCGLLVVPSFAQNTYAPVVEALAAGLLVVGNRHHPSVRQRLREDVNGWLFDDMEPDGMLKALSRAFSSPAEQLDHMRQTARHLVHPTACQSFEGRLHQALQAVMPDVALAPQARLVRWPAARSAR